MRGHQPLIAMRQRGLCPSAVCITVGHDASKCWQQWHLMPWSLIAQIEVQPHERLSALAPDLRCLVGLIVMVSGGDQDRTEIVAQMALEAGAKRVFVTVHNPQTHQVASAAYITEGMQQWQSF